MSTTAAIPVLQAAVFDGAVASALFVLLTGGMVGMSIKNMFDSLLSDDDDVPDDDEITDGGGLMGEEGDDDFGDFGDLEDDDDLGAFGGDELDDAEGGGTDTDELEHRIDEIENEMNSLSSTVSTVRTENEQISESVEEVEENVRKLLDIYEMVTRGVNPFADDVDAGMGGGMGGSGGSFGLFDDDGQGGPDQVDEDVASADAEGFFEDDLDDDELAGGDGAPMDDDGDAPPDDGGTFEEDFDEPVDESGTSFQELKDEYEEEPAHGAIEEDEEGAGEEAEDVGEETEDVGEETEDVGEETEDVGEETEDVGEETEDVGEEAAGAATAAVSGDAAAAAAEPPVDDAGTADPSSRDRRSAEGDRSDRPAEHESTAGRASAGPGKPYLASLPTGFAGDLLVVEWLEFLCSEGGYRATAEAIDYYETIDWIDERVADDLHDVLRGLDGGDGGGGLTIDHHTTSLAYISKLDGDGGQSVAVSKLVGGGGLDGLQR